MSAFLLMYIICALVMISAFVFWIMMVVHAVKHPVEHKAIWILILLITGFVGAVVYYFAIKKTFDAMVPVVVAPTVPPVTPTTPPPSSPMM